MLRVGVLCSGGGTNLQALIDASEAGQLGGAELSLVVASKPEAYALTRANKHGIPALCLPKRQYKEPGAYENALIATLNVYKVELVVLAGFTVVLNKSFIQAFEGRIINIHPALIPSFCGKGFYGLHVHESVLEAGVKVTGATAHFVTEDIDSGPIILQKPVNVHDNDTPESLQRRVMEEAEWVLLPEAVRLIAQDALVLNGRKTHRKEGWKVNNPRP